MSSAANTDFWKSLGGEFSLGFDGYTLGASKTPETDDGDKPADKPAAAAAPAVPATTSSKTAGEWIAANPLAVGVGVVAVLAFAALAMGRK